MPQPTGKAELMRFLSPLRLIAGLLIVAFAGGFSHAAELTVFAAASLSDALKEIGQRYEKSSGDTVRFNLAASSVLALQIKQGAPADVFFAADEAKMDDLAKAGLIAEDTRRSLLSNTLVIVTLRDGGPDLSAPTDLIGPKVRRLALAEPQTVPAGIYAKAYLEKAGLWNPLAAKIIPTENVRACLAAVESGNVDAGIVYKTDAMISKKVKVAFEVPAANGPKISYPVAVIQGSKSEEAARKFAGYLSSDDAQQIFSRYGFTPAR